jgi:transposase
MTGSPLQRAYTWLEPDEGKLSCPVLRGESVSNDALLPDFEGLYGLVRDHLLCDPTSGHVFLFCNAQRNRLKLMVFDGSGLWVCAKRLEGGRFTWPQAGDAQGKVILSHEELTMLLSGIDLAQAQRKRWFRKVNAEELPVAQLGQHP